MSFGWNALRLGKTDSTALNFPPYLMLFCFFEHFRNWKLLYTFGVPNNFPIITYHSWMMLKQHFKQPVPKYRI